MDKRTYKALISLFTTHPSTDIFYGTSDCSFFFTERQADQHARGLNDKTVTDYDREELEDMEVPLDEEEINADNRKELEDRFFEPFGFGCNPYSTNEQLDAAIAYLERYKELNPVVVAPITVVETPALEVPKSDETGDLAKPAAQEPVKVEEPAEAERPAKAKVKTVKTEEE